MLVLLLLAFIAVPILEIYVMILVGQQIGALPTIAIIVALALLGAWLAKREGMGVIARIRADFAAGRMPTNALIDGALVLSGGIMLLFPGFITDAIGIVLLVPPTRAVMRGIVKRRFRIRMYGLEFGGRNARAPGPQSYGAQSYGPQSYGPQSVPRRPEGDDIIDV